MKSRKKAEVGHSRNLVEDFLRVERLPHMWCPGCGIGISAQAFIRAVIKNGIPADLISVVSGIGCTGRVAGYLRFDSFHTTHGRAIPFATGLKLANPSLKVVVFSGDGDLAAIGGNHLIHAARRNVPLTVLLVNNFNYGMTGGQFGPTTPRGSLATTAPYGNYEPPFNLPHLMDVCGAVYIARWTVFHTRHLSHSISEALKKDGFSFIEIISPCPELYLRRNKLGSALEEMKFFQKNSRIANGADTREVALENSRDQIVVGKFVDRERPSYLQVMESRLRKELGDRYNPPPFWQGK